MISSVLLFLPLFDEVYIIFAANGTCKASQGYAGIPEAVSTDGYDCKILLLF